MNAYQHQDLEWRQFERLVSRIERDVGPRGMIVTSPDRIRCKVTGRLREVDVSIRSQIGTTDILITIECRRRSKVQDVTWIEQLVTKKAAIGADRTIAVSASGFTLEAERVADQNGILLRKLSEISESDLNLLLRLDFVLFWHKVCAVVRIGIRRFRSFDWEIPDPQYVDSILPEDTDPLAPIFRDNETGMSWSLNDLWRQLQEATNPFDGIQKAQPPVYRTACFPYPGTVTVDTADGPRLLGDVILTVALWVEAEKVTLDAANKVEYASDRMVAIQRVEFASHKSKTNNWHLSLQIPKDSKKITDLRVGGDWPKAPRSDKE